MTKLKIAGVCKVLFVQVTAFTFFLSFFFFVFFFFLSFFHFSVLGDGGFQLELENFNIQG